MVIAKKRVKIDHFFIFLTKFFRLSGRPLLLLLLSLYVRNPAFIKTVNSRLKSTFLRKFDFSWLNSTFWKKVDFSRLNSIIFKHLTSAG